MPVVEVAVCHRNGVLHDPKGQLVSGSNSQFDGDTHQQVGNHVREAVPLEPTSVEPGGQEGMARCQGAAMNNTYKDHFLILYSTKKGTIPGFF